MGLHTQVAYIRLRLLSYFAQHLVVVYGAGYRRVVVDGDSAHAINQLPGTFFKAMHFAPPWTVVTLVTSLCWRRQQQHTPDAGASKFEGWATSFLMRVAGTPAISG